MASACWHLTLVQGIITNMLESVAERLEFTLKAAALARSQAQLAGNTAAQDVLIQIAEEYEREAEGLKVQLRVSGVS